MKILTVVKPTGDNFIRHYLPYFPIGSKVANRAEDALRIIPNFDIILFEWGNDLTANVINSPSFYKLQKKHNFVTVIRIHDHEVTKIFNGKRRVDHINFDRVDKLWFINPLIQEQFHELKGTATPSFFIPNAVDPDLFPEHQSNTKKAGLVSLLFRARKRIDRIAEIARLLPDWEFCIRVQIPYRNPTGEFGTEFNRFRVLAKDIDNITIENRLVVPLERSGYPNDDLVKWYRDKSVILSTSDHEGFHYAIAEGMSSGCMPVVWPWPGSDRFWKPYIVENAEQAAARIRNYEPSSEYRRYILDYYHPANLTKKLIEKCAI